MYVLQCRKLFIGIPKRADPAAPFPSSLARSRELASRADDAFTSGVALAALARLHCSLGALGARSIVLRRMLARQGRRAENKSGTARRPGFAPRHRRLVGRPRARRLVRAPHPRRAPCDLPTT
jgi:hypothetical protein